MEGATGPPPPLMHRKKTFTQKTRGCLSPGAFPGKARLGTHQEDLPKGAFAHQRLKQGSASGASFGRLLSSPSCLPPGSIGGWESASPQSPPSTPGGQRRQRLRVPLAPSPGPDGVAGEPCNTQAGRGGAGVPRSAPFSRDPLTLLIQLGSVGLGGVVLAGGDLGDEAAQAQRPEPGQVLLGLLEEAGREAGWLRSVPRSPAGGKSPSGRPPGPAAPRPPAGPAR